jgi:transposase
MGLSRSCLYDWLRKYHKERMSGLENRAAPGAESHVTEEMEIWRRKTVLETPSKAYG